jgi:hypothetical protein
MKMAALRRLLFCSLALCLLAAVTGCDPQPGTPFGAFDGVVPDGYGLRVQGWAIDPDTTAPVWIRLSFDGVFILSVTAEEYRPDVEAAYPDYGPHRGFHWNFTGSPGPHTICADAVNTGPGDPTRNLGCGTADIPSGRPIGNLDWVTAAWSPGQSSIQIRIAGWAIDPDTTDPIPVRITHHNVFIDQVQASSNRPDVGAAFPGYGDHHGVDYQFLLDPADPDGTFCVTALNVGQGAGDIELGCQSPTWR